MQDPRNGQLRASGSTLSLSNILSSLKVDVQCAMHNSGNDAFLSLFALQKLLDTENTALPDMKGRSQPLGGMGIARMAPLSPGSAMYASPSMPMIAGPAFTGYAIAAPLPVPHPINRTFPGGSHTNGYLAAADELGQTRRSPNLAGRSSPADRRLGVMQAAEGRNSMVSR